MNRIILSILTAVCVIGLSGIGVASAEEIPVDQNSAARSGMFQKMKMMKNRIGNNMPPLSEEEREAHKAERIAGQAAILGISVEELQTKIESGLHIPEIVEELGIAMEDVQAKMREQAEQKMRERLGQLVEQGKITEEQAQKRLENMKKKADNIDPEQMRARKEERLQKGAELLGISPEELKAQLESGKTMRQISEEQGIDLRELKPPKPAIKDKPAGPIKRLQGFFQGMAKKLPWINQ